MQASESGQFDLCGRFTLTGHYGNSDGLIARSATVLVKAFGWHYFAAMQASEIVVALRADEADAPEELFDNYGEQLIAYCWRLLRNEDATLIAVRDTMIVAQAHAGRLRDPELIGPWLLALARSECERRARAAGHAVKAAKDGDPPAAPPAAATMRQEVLTCLTDPRLARYRAVAAARLGPLDAAGFPASAAAMRVARRPRWHRGAGQAAVDATGPTAGGVAPQALRRPPRRRLHLGGGVLTVSVACSAAVILLAAGVSLQGATAPAAPAASASSAAPGAPALADSARPQGRPVAVTPVAPRSPDLDTPGQPTPAQTQQGLYAISSQPGASGRLLSGSRRGGQAPPVPEGIPPVPVPATGSPWSTSGGAPSSGGPWPGHQWTPPGSSASSSATPTPSPWSPAPWPTRPEGRTWPRPSATTPPASTPAPESTATMAAVWSPDAATTRGPAPAPGATAARRAAGYPARPYRPRWGGHGAR